MKRISLFCLCLSIFAALVMCTSAEAAAKKKKKGKSQSAKVTINYSGKGTASLSETVIKMNQNQSQLCRQDKFVTNASASGVSWAAAWINLKLKDGGNPKATSAEFFMKQTNSTTNSADLTNCPNLQLNDCPVQSPDCVTFTEICENAPFAFFAGSSAELFMEKSGNGFVLKLQAEQLLDINSFVGLSAACSHATSIFDDTVVELDTPSITFVKIKLTPRNRSKTTSLDVTLPSSFDCTDKAKNTTGTLSNQCTLSSALTGTVTVTGKWNASIIN